MNSILVRFKDKNYYIDYDMLLNKATEKLFAFEDPELQKNAKYRGKTLMFNKKDLDDKLKGDIKMNSRMPGAAKTESKNFKENKVTDEQKLRKYIREMVIKTLYEDAPYGQPDEALYLFKTDQDYLQGIQGDSTIDEAKNMQIIGTTKFLDCNEGIIVFGNDVNIRKWFKQFNEEEHEIIFLNYEDIKKQLEKILGVKVEEHFNDYWDENYPKYLEFFVNSMDMDNEIKAKLKGKVFKAKFKAEANVVNEATEQPSAEELAAKQKAAEEAKKKAAYQRFFSQALAKFGYSSPASIPDEKKKAFWNFVDSAWTSKQEKNIGTK